MNESDIQKMTSVLEEIRDNQRIQLERQTDILQIQREHFAIIQKQVDRTEEIQKRAEVLQNKGAQLINGSRKILIIVLPVILILMVYILWVLR